MPSLEMHHDDFFLQTSYLKPVRKYLALKSRSATTIDKVAAPVNPNQLSRAKKSHFK